MTTKAEMERLEAELAKAKAKAEEAEAKLAELDESISSDGLPDRFAGMDLDEMVNITTIAPGSWGMDGVVQPGTQKSIKLGQYSREWMKPADPKSAAAINAYIKAKDQRREDQVLARKRERAAIAKLAAK